MELFAIVLIIFFTSLIATMLSSMSGGGSSIISIPIFLWIGMPYALAISIQQVCAVFWVLPASYNYLTERKIDWKFLIIFGTVGLLGVVIGISALPSFNEDILKTIVGIAIIILVLYIALNSRLGIKQKEIKSKFLKNISYLTALPMGFYESIFGSGNGLIFSVAGYHTRGFDLKQSLGYYYAVAFAWCSIAAVLLIIKGFYNVPYMISATIGSVIGGYYGSRLGNYKGNAFIKVMFVTIGLVLGIKLAFNL